MFKQSNSIAGLAVAVASLLFAFISGCNEDKTTKSLYVEFTLEGTWIEEYEVIVPNPAENMGFHNEEDTLLIKSVVTFSNDSFFINILNKNGAVLNERSGVFQTAADTIIFSFNDGGETDNVRTLQYKFIDKDKLNLSTISYPTENPNIFTIEFCGVVWELGSAVFFGGFYPGSLKTSGTFIRQ